MEAFIIVVGFIFSVLLLYFVLCLLTDSLSPDFSIKNDRRKSRARARKRAVMKKLGHEPPKNNALPYLTSEEPSSNITRQEIRISDQFPSKNSFMIRTQ